MSQTISGKAERSDSTASTPAKNFSRVLFRVASNRLLVAILIFLTAFALRAGHNLSLEHRVWYFEDAQNYLRSGASIYRMVNESKSPSQLLQNIKDDSKNYSGVYNAFTSDKLVDRVLTDGAIFPIYLAGVEAIAGLDTKNPQYEKIAIKASLANSLLDSATCVLIFLLGALLFGFAPGALAAALYAFYPPAIVNTQWCMSETFCSFMLVSSIYCLARFLMVPPNLVARRILWGTITGVVSGLTILARSAFPVFVPLICIAAFAGSRSRTTLLSPAPIIALVLSFLLTILPWCLYTQMALGQPRLTTNRLPAYNVVSGNLASIDGYTPFPSTVRFPEEMKEAVIMVAAEAREKPVEFLLLEMKKVARLWSSVWNDCKYSVLGFNASAQNVFHQLMLFLALCWGFIVVGRTKRHLTDGELLGTWLTFSVIAVHFIYLAFIALSRYAFTAMPFVILAASAALCYWLRSGETARKRLAIVLTSFVAVSALTNEFRSFSQFVCAIVPETWWFQFAPWLTSGVAILAYAGVWYLAVRAIHRLTNEPVPPIEAIQPSHQSNLTAPSPHRQARQNVGDNETTDAAGNKSSLVSKSEVGTSEVETSGVETSGVGTSNVGTSGVETSGVGTSDVGTSRVETSGVGTSNVGTSGVGAPVLHTSQVGTSESGASEIGSSEVAWSEPNMSDADSARSPDDVSSNSAARGAELGAKNPDQHLESTEVQNFPDSPSTAESHQLETPSSSDAPVDFNPKNSQQVTTSPEKAITAEDISRRSALTTLAAASYLLTSCGIIGCIVGSRTWSEWSCPLTNQTAHQTIQLPDKTGSVSETGYVILDLHDEEPLPQLEVEVNDQVLDADPIPVGMIQKENESINGSLTMQANSMDMDFRTLRHWYAVPFSTKLLQQGKQNTIAVRNKRKTHPVTIYGDYTPTTSNSTDGTQVLPSVNSLSWNYAVEGSDYRSPMEPRLLESIQLNGKTTESSLVSPIRSHDEYKDLSPAFGTQWGRYRLRLLLQPRSAKQLAKQAQLTTPQSSSTDSTTSDVVQTIFEQKPDQEQTVHGGNPVTFYLASQTIPISEELVAKHPFKFTCELKTEKRPVNAFINLVFKTGIGDVWIPEWQPECIPVNSEGWKKLTIIDAFPKRLLEHNGVTVQPIVTPFGKDLLFTQHKKAGKQAVLIRNAKLEFINTPITERSNLFTWKVF
ncbi:MAG: hypothetical protein SGJ27_30375 [Candidatus Melainabacteria bacterium]|nr:hypothetical protein [Candidatus Melainabacteria bacterium]